MVARDCSDGNVPIAVVVPALRACTAPLSLHRCHIKQHVYVG